ncbi:DNA repair protein RecN [Granulicoccus phenolivorans]|uniref:DNA repair protein RecN n=1 Tax=Granulicoccus phenolivorans TaxID=266854 RepID=UPI00041DF6D2|nr:DNA repair protein RecN [Granulicoccus phenolivorans]
MLSDLHITNLGVIAEATCELSGGFTVVTGETGAGKTMVVTGLGMLLGHKVDSGLVRRGTDKARVEGTFTAVRADIAARVDEAGGAVEDDELLVARQVSGGRSRTFLGGTAVPTAVCAEVSEQLITIHGQSGQARLASHDHQRHLLDRFAGPALAEVAAEHRAAYTRRRSLAAELSELTERSRERAREIDLLRFGLDEISAADPQPGEDHDLLAEANRLQDVDDLRLGAQEALAALAGSEDDIDAASTLTSAAIANKALQRIAAADPTAAPYAERAAEISALAADLATDLSAYHGDLQADPGRLAWIGERRAVLQTLTRKYGDSIDEVLTWASEAARSLETLTSSDDRIETLRAEIADLDAQLERTSTRLTALRTDAAARFAEQAQAELAALAMPHARLQFTLDTLPEPGPTGIDRVELEFTANPGNPLRPIGKVASGGELSRVRLALEVVLAGEEEAATFVFDEVDAGIGGRVGLEIGRRLARLARHNQVIAVTHLAQVAAFADRHLVVAKASDGAVTTSGVRTVAEADRAVELARMMAGLDTSDTSLAHAQELLDTAAGDRAAAHTDPPPRNGRATPRTGPDKFDSAR